jgi:hypothetical protein
MKRSFKEEKRIHRLRRIGMKSMMIYYIYCNKTETEILLIRNWKKN